MLTSFPWCDRYWATHFFRAMERNPQVLQVWEQRTQLSLFLGRLWARKTCPSQCRSRENLPNNISSHISTPGPVAWGTLPKMDSYICGPFLISLTLLWSSLSFMTVSVRWGNTLSFTPSYPPYSYSSFWSPHLSFSLAYMCLVGFSCVPVKRALLKC